MKQFAALAVIGVGLCAIPAAEQEVQASPFVKIDPGPGSLDTIPIDGCGTIGEAPIIFMGTQVGTVKVWTQDLGGGFGLTVRGGGIDAFDVGEQVYIEGEALLAITDVYPPLPGLQLINATFSDCE